MRPDLSAFFHPGPSQPHSGPNSGGDFDAALLEAAMALVAEQGWARLSLVEAAREAGLPLAQVRAFYPCKAKLLLRLNRLADEAALEDESSGGTVRERLFDRFMRRFDVFQEYRDGLCAVMRALPFDPALAALLGAATLDSLRWMADSAGLDRNGLTGIARLQALLAVWTHALRAWEKDATPDLTETMNALDAALARAERFGFLKTTQRQPTPDQEDGGLPDHVPAALGNGFA